MCDQIISIDLEWIKLPKPMQSVMFFIATVKYTCDIVYLCKLFPPFVGFFTIFSADYHVYARASCQVAWCC